MSSLTTSSTIAAGQATSGSDLASCVSAWNTGSSSSDQQGLNGAAALVSPDVAVATYAGPTEMVGQVGSVTDIPVESGRCLVIGGGAVFVQQNDGSWALSTPILTGNFSAFADPSTTATDANAQASVGAGAESGVGLLTADPEASLVTLTGQDVNGTPLTSGGSANTNTSPGAITPEDVRKAQQMLPECQKENAQITLQQLEQEAAGPLGIQC